MYVQLGRKIEIPDYTEEEREIYVMKDCPAYTGIMAAINGIAYQKYGCYSHKLTEEQREIVDREASQIGMAWFEMPEEWFEDEEKSE